MKLAEKYNIPQETIKAMVKDGVISCSWPMREELFDLYTQMKGTGKTQSQICYEISQAKGVSESTVKQAIQKLR